MGVLGGCSGTFEEDGTWYNADKSKMLVAEYAADGKTKKWRERQDHQTFASFKVLSVSLLARVAVRVWVVGLQARTPLRPSPSRPDAHTYVYRGASVCRLARVLACSCRGARVPFLQLACRCLAACFCHPMRASVAHLWHALWLLSAWLGGLVVWCLGALVPWCPPLVVAC